MSAEHQYRRIHPRRRSRRGIEILELILTLPILFLTLAAGVQFSSVLAVDSTLCNVSLEVARLAAMECSEDQLVDRAGEMLSIHDVALGPGVALLVEDSSGLVHQFGDGTLSSSTLGTPVDLDCVRATLLVTTESTPIPNTLRDYCVDFDGKTFEHVTVLPKQTCDCSE